MLPGSLEPGEVDTLTGPLCTRQDRAMIAAMVLGGLRRCEVLGCGWGICALVSGGCSSLKAKAATRGWCRYHHGSSPRSAPTWRPSAPGWHGPPEVTDPPGAMSVPRTAGTVPALRPTQPGHILVEHGDHHLQASPDGQGQQASPCRFGDLGHRHDHLPGDGNLPRHRIRPGTAAALLIGVTHGGPASFVGRPGSCPTPATWQATGGGPPLSSSTKAGTSSWR